MAQFVGLARWPFLVPKLARKYDDPGSTEATREATVVVFESFHTYLGVAIRECLDYLFTGAWTELRTKPAPPAELGSRSVAQLCSRLPGVISA